MTKLISIDFLFDADARTIGGSFTELFGKTTVEQLIERDRLISS